MPCAVASLTLPVAMDDARKLDPRAEAVRRIQTWWRQRCKGRTNGDSRADGLVSGDSRADGRSSEDRRGSDDSRRSRQSRAARCEAAAVGGSPNVPRSREPRRSSRRVVKAPHHAAARIQRAWKVHNWRRQFVDYSEHQNGWVGSLDWLQQNNLLYGTELADSEDVRWWVQQRTTAPLDREVDPWGFERLREHLNRVWYGCSSGEAEPRGREALTEDDAGWELSQHHCDFEQEDIFAAFAAPQETLRRQPPVTTSASSSRACRRIGVASSLRSLPVAEQSGRRQVSMSARTAGKPVRDGASLSPRHEAIPWVSADQVGRCKGAMFGAPPPSMHSYKSQTNYRVASHSPLQTHRTARAVPVTPASFVALRPRSPVPSEPSREAALRPRSPAPTETTSLRPRSPVQSTRLPNSGASRMSLTSTNRAESWAIRAQDVRRGRHNTTNSVLQEAARLNALQCA